MDDDINLRLSSLHPTNIVLMFLFFFSQLELEDFLSQLEINLVSY